MPRQSHAYLLGADRANQAVRNGLVKYLLEAKPADSGVNDSPFRVEAARESLQHALPLLVGVLQEIVMEARPGTAPRDPQENEEFQRGFKDAVDEVLKSLSNL
ncbi:hypothetical protein [Candidatus Palauibacter sp.]|uniref:hypothetical protein n=1 Tax=Candidatus Palauibacter sp. TaxID=3101350 RepID=UPI003B5B9E85